MLSWSSKKSDVIICSPAAFSVTSSAGFGQSDVWHTNFMSDDNDRLVKPIFNTGQGNRTEERDELD